VLEPGRPQITIRHMRIARRITQPTSTHSEYVIFIAFPHQQWLLESGSMLRHSYIACLLAVILT